MMRHKRSERSPAARSCSCKHRTIASFAPLARRFPGLAFCLCFALRLGAIALARRRIAPRALLLRLVLLASLQRLDELLRPRQRLGFGLAGRRGFQRWREIATSARREAARRQRPRRRAQRSLARFAGAFVDLGRREATADTGVIEV